MTPNPPTPGWGFLLKHPAHALALGLGSGLAPRAPGTVGTLWGWAAFLAISPWMNDARWGLLLAVALPLAWWSSSVTARHLGVLDPSCVVIDEVVAFWIVLWLLMPSSWWDQAWAFVLFRFFDAVKPGPVGWADRLCHDLPPGPGLWVRVGGGIVLDDLVAAFCTLLVLAGVRAV